MPKRRMKRHAVTQPLDQPYRFIPLTQGQNAIVDANDFDKLNKFNWSAKWNKYTHSFYATRKAPTGHKPTHIAMHRQILNCRSKKEVDHISHLTLDNRKENLRKATHSQNQRNHRMRSDNRNGFIGVNWDIEAKKWKAHIWTNGKQKTIGRFPTAEEAAYARDAAARKHHADFAQLNFPNLHVSNSP